MTGDPMSTTHPDPVDEQDALFEVPQGYVFLPHQTYLNRLNGIASVVCSVIDEYDNERDRTLISLYDLAKKTLEDEFTDFIQNDKFRHVWKKVTDATPNVQVKDAKQTIIDKWGEYGARFLELNLSPDWSVTAARLAQQCPEYEVAARYIVRVILDRLPELYSGTTLSLGPQLVDLVRACDLAESVPSISPATERELREISVMLNAQQLLEPLGTIEAPFVSPRTFEAPRLPAVIGVRHDAGHGDILLPTNDVETFEDTQSYYSADEVRGNRESSTNAAQISVFSRKTLSDQIPLIQKDTFQRLGYKEGEEDP